MNTITTDTGRGYSVFNAMVDIIAAPTTAIDEIRHRTRWLWWPLLVTIFAGAGAFTFYYLWVDFPWMVDEMVRTTVPPGADPAHAQGMRDFLSPGTQITFSALGITVVTLLVYAIQSGYLHLVNKVTGDPSISYGQWFSLSAWTGFLGIFNALAMMVVLLTAGTNQVSPHDLVPLSINSLLIHAEPGTAWHTWGSSLTLVHLWVFAILILGYSRWTGASFGKAAAIVAAPWVLLFGVWALLIA